MTDKLQRILPTVQKPARYTGGEYNEIKKNLDDVRVRVAFCFPDTYEIGMSNVGMRILYGVMNQMDGVWCERVFAPWIDFEKIMRENDIPLYALESHDNVKDFDFMGFTLQYELSYTNVLNMLDLAGIPCDYGRLMNIVDSKRDIFHAANDIQKAIGRVAICADAAHSFGASKNGKMVGAIADFSSFSFHAVKNFTTAEGGALTWKSIPSIEDEEI